jgi:hypothetical protein
MSIEYHSMVLPRANYDEPVRLATPWKTIALEVGQYLMFLGYSVLFIMFCYLIDL